MDEKKRNEIYGIVLIAIGTLVLISLISFDFNDLKAFTSRPNYPIRNFAGIFGAYIGLGLFCVMGLSAYVIAILVFMWALARFWGLTPQKIYLKISGTVFLIIASSTLFSMIAGSGSTARFRFGGFVGMMTLDFLLKYFGTVGTLVIISVLFLLSVLLATEFLLLPFLSRFVKGTQETLKKAKARLPAERAPTKESRKWPESIPAQRPSPSKEPAKVIPQPKVVAKESLPGKRPEETPVTSRISPEPAVQEKKEAPVPEDYMLPGIDLLNSPPPIEERKITEDVDGNSRILEETLSDFDVEAKVVACNRGPVITRYELELASGVKLHKITSLGDNIALAMKAQSVRIVAPIPGKGTVGVEMPNSMSALVFLKEILDAPEFKDSDFKLKLALGKDIAGSPVIADLSSMPHLLIAGTTGSGKTVCVNSLIISLLFSLRPDELKFIMIDPKRVELAVFGDLPHLLAPVVTEPKKVSLVLDWVVREMESRYETFAQAGVRNIDLYNQKFGKDRLRRMSYIIVIIDELADLMMVAQTDIESAITRLAQLSRAVGIHIILATQRPSVDVITGVIKANFPARISFKVASKVDSRTVLDMNGADKLLGKGDMLFIEPGQSKLIRAQGSLISDEEIERIVSFIKTQCGPNYREEILEEFKKKTTSFKKFEKDEVYEEAVRVVIESQQASVSMLQRRLGLGYTRAARLIDMMEDEGIVGPYQGSRPREVLSKPENLPSTGPTGE